MKNSEAWSHYNKYTDDLNKFSRELGLAGSAICWVLKDSNGIFPKYVLFGLILFVLFFIADIIQKLIGALRHKCWIEKREAELWNSAKTIEGEYLKPKSLDKPAFYFFIIKIFFLLLGFVVLGASILNKQLNY
ncbi:hypothetical protein [Methyloglobulus sp.]|uniref:hypothetical protein n=1 Tax=Methyloglobulus sp. TaxID=2518622 RepID=UPI0032B75FA9